MSGDLVFAGIHRPLRLPELLAGGDTELPRVVPHPPSDSVAVLPGHGPRTTVGRERETNPFLQVLA